MSKRSMSVDNKLKRLCEKKINFGAYPYNLVLASKAYTVFLALRLDGPLNRVQKNLYNLVTNAGRILPSKNKSIHF